MESYTDSQVFSEPEYDNSFDFMGTFQPALSQPVYMPTSNSDSYSNSETESEVPTYFGTSPECDDIICTDIKHLREVIAARTHFSGEGQLGRHLKPIPGLIILPLYAISILRQPVGRHVGNPHVIVFHPTLSPENYQCYPQFIECLNRFYS